MCVYSKKKKTIMFTDNGQFKAKQNVCTVNNFIQSFTILNKMNGCLLALVHLSFKN